MITICRVEKNYGTFKDMSLRKEIWDKTRNYQNRLVGRETSVLSPSLALFLGSGAKPLKKPQNSPASTSTINFQSSMSKGEIINIKYSNQKDASNHEDATWRNKEDEDIVDIPKIEEPITAKIRTQIQ